jgi:hypothetical protein
LAATLEATPALAAGTASAIATTCADLMAPSPEGQMAEVAMMHDAMAAEATGDAMVSDDAMALAESAADDMAADTIASDEMTEVMAACEGNPDMMVMDVIPAHAMAPATI